MSTSNKVPEIPAIDLSIPTNIANMLRPMKEAIEIMSGLRNRGQALGAGVGFDGWKRKTVTLEMLLAANLITEAQAKDLLIGSKMPTPQQEAAYQAYLQNYYTQRGQSQSRSGPSTATQLAQYVPTASKLAFGKNNTTGNIADVFGLYNAYEQGSPGKAILPAASIVNRYIPNTIPGMQYLGPASAAYNILQPGQNRSDYAKSILTSAPTLLNAAGSGLFGTGAATALGSTVGAGGALTLSPLLAGLGAAMPWVGAAILAYQALKPKKEPSMNTQLGFGDQVQNGTGLNTFGNEGFNVNQWNDQGQLQPFFQQLAPIDQQLSAMLTPEQRATVSQQLAAMPQTNFSFNKQDPYATDQIKTEYLAKKYGAILNQINPTAARYFNRYGGYAPEMLQYLQAFASNPNTPAPTINTNIYVPGQSGKKNIDIFGDLTPGGGYQAPNTQRQQGAGRWGGLINDVVGQVDGSQPITPVSSQPTQSLTPLDAGYYNRGADLFGTA